MQKVQVIDAGLIPYADALDMQTAKFNELIEHKMSGHSNADAHCLYLCEHYPVITLGKSAREQNILLPESLLQEKGIELFHISRGGDVTFHGPANYGLSDSGSGIFLFRYQTVYAHAGGSDDTHYRHLRH